MRLILFFSLLAWAGLYNADTSNDVHEFATVPEKMMYCGIQLTLTEGAQEKIQQQIKKLYENPRYFNMAVDRADTYMPFIEEALEDANLPDDLKYLAIQESNLQPDAVSSSNAVGFWQFKEIPAKEMGLRIDSLIDERKHVFRASQAAAAYFIKSNQDFNNWLYAVIAYYEGLTGAVQYTNPEYYGKKEMMIDENLHWYALRALAYKIAYEENLKISNTPKLWLEPYTAKGPVTLKELAQKHNVKEEDLSKVNLWMVAKRIPIDAIETYYLPKNNLSYAGHKFDPTKDLLKPAPTVIETTTVVTTLPENITEPEEPIVTATEPKVDTEPLPTPTASTGVNIQPASGLPSFTVPSENTPAIAAANANVALAMYEVEEDPLYDEQFTIYDGTKLLADLALVYKKRYADLLKWNRLQPGVEPRANSLIYLIKPSKAMVHVVKPKESLKSISQFHGKSVGAIKKKNRMEKKDFLIYEGQKLYLKHPREKNEKVIILSGKYLEVNKPVVQLPVEEKPAEVEEIKTTPPPTPQPMKPSETTPTVSTPNVTTTIVTPQPTTVVEPPKVSPEPSAIWINYVVQQGEGLWTIATRFGTKVEIIKKSNGLTSDLLSPNQVLKIYAKKDKANNPNATPIPPIQTITYKVNKGDSLHQISQRYGTTIDTIMKENGLSNQALKEGQILKITITNE